MITIIIRKKEFEDPNPLNLYRAKRYGDIPVREEAAMHIPYQFPPPWGDKGNFQNMFLFSVQPDFQEFGDVHLTLKIPNADFRRIERFQPMDGFDIGYKMAWLSALYKESIYWTEPGEDWKSGADLWWGTIILGNNIVQVIRTETFHNVTMRKDLFREKVEMAICRGFTPADWDKPQKELIETGLLHRCTCAYTEKDIPGDTPVGIVYSPFWHPHGDLFRTGWRLQGWRRMDSGIRILPMS
jgi:hypothetical protein